MTGLPLLSVSKVRQVYRFLLIALNQWAEEEPPARIQERVASLTLFPTSQRQVKAAPREVPVKGHHPFPPQTHPGEKGWGGPRVKDFGETAGSRKRETNRSASACNQPSSERRGQ